MDSSVVSFCATAKRRIGRLWLFVCLFSAYAGVLGSGSCIARTPAAAREDIFKIGARGSNEAPGVIKSMLFAEPLISIDWQGRAIPRLALGFEWQDDPLALRIRLRPNARFHDGTPVTAGPVVDIIRQQIKKSENGSFDSVQSVEAADDYTIVMRLARPDTFLTSALANMSVVNDDKP